MRIRLSLESEQTVLSFPDYPSYCLGNALNGLSVDGGCFLAPHDRNPDQNWCWRFETKFREAVVKLAEHFEHEVVE